MEGDGTFVGVLGVFGGGVGAVPAGSAGELLVVVDHVAVVDHGETRFAGDLSGLVEERAGEGDVVGLPFAGRAAGVYEGFLAAIEGTALAVRVGGVFGLY